MPALANEAACSVSQKLLALLQEARDPCRGVEGPSFSDRLDTLEIEALETCAAGGTLVVISMAREAVRFAERVSRPSRKTLSALGTHVSSITLLAPSMP